jgi:predicted DNA-binding transcriptional regulator YafY
MSTSSRLLALLSLLQTPRSWSGGELAERLEVSRRTVRRDVDRLRDLGYPVEGTLGADGGYRLGAGREMPPLLLDDDEAVAIVVGLRAAAIGAVAGIDEAAARALAKLEQVLPPRLRSRFEGLRAATSRFDWQAPSVDPAVLTVVARAISGREQLRFTYRTPDGASARRSVDPSGLVVVGRRWYLVAWDVDREGWRIFRADRVADPWSTGRPIPDRVLPGGSDPATYVREHQLSLAPTFRLVATLDAPIGRLTPAAGDASELERIDAEHTRITIEDDTLEWLAFRLILLDCDFEIHEPPELEDYLGRLAQRLGHGHKGEDARREPPGMPRAASRSRSSPS